MNVKSFSSIIQVVLWVTTMFCAVIWVKEINFPYEPEPLTVILALISGAVSTLARMYRNNLKMEKFSTANALALGYVNNFIEPTLTQLIKDLSKSMQQPFLNIYIPNQLSELSIKNIDRMKVSLKEKGIKGRNIKVNLDEGRGLRDVMTLTTANMKNVYLDFPNTLRTLCTLIDYKVKSPKDSLCKKEKDKLGQEYIQVFKNTMEESLTEKNLYPRYIKFVDSNLEITSQI